MSPSPIFLIGAARSGTKYFRDQIAKDPAFSATPYDANYLWRIGNSRLSHDVLEPRSCTEQQRGLIQKSLVKIAGLESEQNISLVEKSVSNTLRVPFVNWVFPDARFIHLVRDGRAVVESSRRMWKAPPDGGGLIRKLRDLPLSQYDYVFWFALNYAKGLVRGRSGGAVWGPRYPGIMKDIEQLDLTEIVARQWRYSVEYATRDLSTLPAERVFTIRYEDINNNDGKLDELAQFVEAKDSKAFIQGIRDGFQSGNNEKWRQNLSEDDIAAIENEAHAQLKQYGYLES